MKTLTLTIALCLMAGPALATFEIADPANEMVEERRAAELAEKTMQDQPLCVQDSDSEKCWCFDRVTGEQLSMPEEECKARASEQLEITEP
jgi:hypothetical protein